MHTSEVCGVVPSGMGDQRLSVTLTLFLDSVDCVGLCLRLSQAHLGKAQPCCELCIGCGVIAAHKSPILKDTRMSGIFSSMAICPVRAHKAGTASLSCFKHTACHSLTTGVPRSRITPDQLCCSSDHRAAQGMATSGHPAIQGELGSAEPAQRHWTIPMAFLAHCQAGRR